MIRMQTIDPKTVIGETKALFDAAQTRLGTAPKFLRALAVETTGIDIDFPKVTPLPQAIAAT